MTTLLRVPRTWELLKRFKDSCKLKGWKIWDEADWIRTGHEYHDFVWSSNVHPSTFKRISKNHKCTVSDGFAYRIVNASYVAWIFQQQPSPTIVQTVMEDPELSQKTAIYDLSQVYEGKDICHKLNATNSQVFREFERFLTETWGVAIRSV